MVSACFATVNESGSNIMKTLIAVEMEYTKPNNRFGARLRLSCWLVGGVKRRYIPWDYSRDIPDTALEAIGLPKESVVAWCKLATPQALLFEWMDYETLHAFFNPNKQKQ